MREIQSLVFSFSLLPLAISTAHFIFHLHTRADTKHLSGHQNCGSREVTRAQAQAALNWFISGIIQPCGDQVLHWGWKAISELSPPPHQSRCVCGDRQSVRWTKSHHVVHLKTPQKQLWCAVTVMCQEACVLVFTKRDESHYIYMILGEKKYSLKLSVTGQLK